MYWIGFIVRGVFYLLCIAIMAPVLWAFHIDEREPSIDDGVGYDDNDPGEDLDTK